MRESIRDRERLQRILDSINRIHSKAPFLSVESLTQDVLVYYGIVKNIEIIGGGCL